MNRATLALCLSVLPTLVAAAPENGQVVAGQATIAKPDALTTSILQGSQSAIINWKGFSIDVNELVKFTQPGAEAVALNRVTGVDPSTILGQLVANGRVFLVNPNGILFGPHSKVDVGSLIATTFDIKDSDFLAGKYEFVQKPGAKPSFVVNQGEIKVAKNGAAFLVAQGAKNEGLIIAHLGTVTLGAGNKLKVDFRGDGLITYSVEGKVLESVTGPDGSPLGDLVSNTGTIQNDGGTVALTGEAKREVAKSVVNQEGVIRANSLRFEGGKVFVEARGEGIAQNQGSIDVSAGEANAKAGQVSVTGGLAGNFGQISAAGGEVLVNSAEKTVLGSQSTIDVSGQGAGDAGTIEINSQGDTLAAGTLLAKGGQAGGDGGFVEVSAKGAVGLTAAVDASSAAGETGTLLLDPVDIEVAAAGAAVIGEVSTFAASPGTNQTVSPATLDGAGANVVLQAQNDLTVTDAINLATTPNANLTMQAGRTVAVNANVATNGAGTITIVANNVDNNETDASGVP